MLSIRHSINALGLCAALLWGCNPSESNTKEIVNQEKATNPAQPGFDLENSDPKAIAIADSIMKAMGGRQKWDDTRFFSWDFFGRRTLVWDKLKGRVRIETPYDSSIYLVNVFDLEGKVMHKGANVENPDTLATLLKKAKSIWINDAYWLVMPFKLKDSGVTLKYARSEETVAGDMTDVLQLTFDGVGDTPSNKYELFVDREVNLITKWAYFREASQDSASYIWPFDNYQNFNGLLISTDRSDGKGPSNTKVLANIPDEVFESFEPVTF